MRFLVTDRREQAPVDADLGACRLEHGAVARQAALVVADEIARADVVVFLGMAVVAIVHARQHAGAVGGNDELVGTGQQRVARALREGPRKRVIDEQVQRDPEVGIEVPLDIEIRAVCDSEVDPALCHPGQEFS